MVDVENDLQEMGLEKEPNPKDNTLKNNTPKDNASKDEQSSPKKSAKNLHKTTKTWINGATTKEAMNDNLLVEAKLPNFIRIRTSFDVKQESHGEMEHHQETKRVLLQFKKVLEEVKPKAKIAPWKENGNKVSEDIEKMSPTAAKNCVDVPPWAASECGIQRHFRFGIRTNASQKLYQFTNLWSQCRSGEGWSHVTKAKMQSSSMWNAVGQLAGSTNEQCLGTLNAWLKVKFPDKKVEASQQNVREVGNPGVLKNPWEEAKKTAKSESKTNATHNAMKSKLAPQELCSIVAMRRMRER